MDLLALFPLGATVLFPGSAVSLHIFEERYKQMIGGCILRKEPFGIVLIREGEEVGNPAEPYDVGTSVVIVGAYRYENGEMDIVVKGRSRFRIDQIVQNEPYIIAAVEYLEEDTGFEQRVQAEQLRDLYERYRATVPYATGVPQPLDDLPVDPVTMSFQLSAQLQIPDLSKQLLLEADLETRLEALSAALEGELRLLLPPSNTPISPSNSWSYN